MGCQLGQDAPYMLSHRTAHEMPSILLAIPQAVPLAVPWEGIHPIGCLMGCPIRRIMERDTSYSQSHGTPNILWNPNPNPNPHPMWMAH